MEARSILDWIRQLDPYVTAEVDRGIPGQDWLPLAPATTDCAGCGASQMLIVRERSWGSPSFDSFSSCVALCLGERLPFRMNELGMEVQREINKQLDTYSSNHQDAPAQAIESVFKAYGLGSKTESQVQAIVPLGFRPICWIGVQESRMIIESYSQKRDISIKNKNHVEVCRIRYLGDNKKYERLCDLYRAQVTLLRLNTQTMRLETIVWMREEEALAALQAFEVKQDVSFRHRQKGNGGLIQYFDATSPVAQTFRYQLRLLRTMRSAE